MEKQIKRLIKKNGKFLVETEDKKSTQFLSEKILKGRGDRVEAEWVYSFESPLVKPLMGKQWSQWVFGACAKEIGLIHIYLDNILKAYSFCGFSPVEERFSSECTKHLVHELIHFHCPEWSESQVGRASQRLMESDVPKATKLTVHIGDRKFTHLLTRDNRVLGVKSK